MKPSPDGYIEATHIGYVVDINRNPERLLYGPFKKAADFYSMSDGRPICRPPLHLPEGSPPRIASNTRNVSKFYRTSDDFASTGSSARFARLFRAHWRRNQHQGVSMSQSGH